MLVNRLDPCCLYRSEAVIDQTLTIDVFKVMLGHLDTVDEINDAKSVSKYWYRATLSMVKDLNILRLSKLCGILQMTLKEEDSKAIPLCDSFMGLQEAIFKTRDKIVDLLKPLGDEELDKLECEPCRFFEHFLEANVICEHIFDNCSLW